VATPTLDEGMGCKIRSIDLSQFRLVKPDLGPAVDFIAVIKHEATLVRVTEVFKIGDLHASTRLSCIQVINELFLCVEEDQIDMEFLLDGLQVGEEVPFFLSSAATNVGGLVDKPSDHGVRTVLGSKLLQTNARGMDKVRPPMIMGNFFEFFPLDQRGAADYYYIFLVYRLLAKLRHLGLQERGGRKG
jgi:hypothetical protein